VPLLGQVLGAFLADVIRARLAADELTAEAVDAYRADPVLASLSVPRVTVSDMTVRLRFLVSGFAVPEPGAIDIARATEEWNVGVWDRVLTRLLRARGDDALREDVELLRESLRSEPIIVGADVLQAAAGGDTDPLVGLTVSAVLERVRALPPAARRRLGTLAQLREDLQREVTREAHVLTDRLGQRQAAEQVLRSRLEIEVEADKLQESRVESIQELDVTVTLADAEEFIAATDRER